MTKQTWTLTDVEQDIFVEHISLSADHVPGRAAGYSVNKRTLRGGLREGVDVIEVNNGLFRFVVIPTRGMGLWRAGIGDLQLGWKSPVKGPVHPSFVRLSEANGLGWLGGFDELLCRCGLESNGAPEFAANGSVRYALHGKIANTPAHQVAVTIDGESGEITVAGTVDETRLFGSKLRLTTAITTKAGQPGLTITDTIHNLSGEPSELELLYHTNFGLPFIGPGAKVVLAVKKGAPRDAVAVKDVPQWDTYGPFSPGAPEVVFFFELAADHQGQTQTLLHNAAGDRGVSLKFDTRQLPCFSFWKNRQAEADGYVTGLEPGINFPNVRSFEKDCGRVAVLAPGESRTCAVTLEAHVDAPSVDGARQAVAALQGSTKPEFLKQPNPEWSN